jgi:hypothetical protein
MKPEAPVEIRGEFKPIKTNVPGIDICELLPLQAKIADRFSIIRGFETNGSHDSRMLTTGFKPGLYRPAFGSVVSRLLPGESGGLPPYITLVQESNLPFGQYPAYLGPAHAPFGLRGKGVADLTPPRHADRAKSKPFTPRNLLATLYHLLGIDAATTLPDHTGRPQFLLDDRDRIDELL